MELNKNGSKGGLMAAYYRSDLVGGSLTVIMNRYLGEKGIIEAL